MCKFCDSLKKTELMNYDNTKSMHISCGQYRGVNVQSILSMKGNMLVLEGSGSYRSKADCYYEDEGIECDNENSQDGESSILKIEFCPFCGKKLSDSSYEKEISKRRIKELKEDIELCENILEKNFNKGYIKIIRALNNSNYKSGTYLKGTSIQDGDEVKFYFKEPREESFEDVKGQNGWVYTHGPYKDFIANDISKIKFKFSNEWNDSLALTYISNDMKFSDEDIEKVIENGNAYYVNYYTDKSRKLRVEDFKKIKKKRDKVKKLLDDFKKELETYK